MTGATQMSFFGTMCVKAARSGSRVSKSVEQIKIAERPQSHHQSQGESVNGFINCAIDNQMERDASDGPQTTPGAAKCEGEV